MRIVAITCKDTIIRIVAIVCKGKINVCHNNLHHFVTKLFSDLLQESSDLTGAPLVRFGEVEILEIHHQSFAVLGAIHSAGRGAHGHA